MICPSCGAENQNGKFCAECGAGLDVNCPSCGASVDPGSRFCTACGERLAATSGGRVMGSHVAWVIAAAAVVVILLLLFLPRQTDRVAAPPAGGATTGAPAMGGGDGAGPGVLSSDMRTNADRLFNRIMLAAEQGNQAEVQRFMPMAVQAYDMVEDLNDDGIYHLAILHQTAGNHAEARRTAERILDRAPNHILALGVAASAAAEAGDTAAADTLWARILDAYPEESERSIPEYVDHATMLDRYRQMAAEATGTQ